MIAIDLLGFGESPAPDDATYTIAEHEAALARTIDSLRLREPFVLVGHSMGSLIAARYAATHPRRLRKLVLVSPPVYLPTATISVELEAAAQGLYYRVYEFLRANPFDVRRPYVAAKVAAKLAGTTLLGRPSKPRQYRFDNAQPGPQVTEPAAHQVYVAAKG